jgi:hypothetical protein
MMRQPSTIARIAGTTVEAMPSHLASLRGYDGVREIVADEVDYFQPAQQKKSEQRLRVLLANQLVINNCTYFNAVCSRGNHAAN